MSSKRGWGTRLTAIRRFFFFVSLNKPLSAHRSRPATRVGDYKSNHDTAIASQQGHGYRKKRYLNSSQPFLAGALFLE
jgi:hypothetical protein